MARMKGMSTTLKIVVTVVVLLVAALVVLSVFAGGIGGITQVLQGWISGTQNIKSCAQAGGSCISIDKVGECMGTVDYISQCPGGNVCCIGGN